MLHTFNQSPLWPHQVLHLYVCHFLSITSHLLWGQVLVNPLELGYLFLVHLIHGSWLRTWMFTSGNMMGGPSITYSQPRGNFVYGITSQPGWICMFGGTPSSRTSFFGWVNIYRGTIPTRTSIPMTFNSYIVLLHKVHSLVLGITLWEVKPMRILYSLGELLLGEIILTQHVPGHDIKILGLNITSVIIFFHFSMGWEDLTLCLGVMTHMIRMVT